MVIGHGTAAAELNDARPFGFRSPSTELQCCVFDHLKKSIDEIIAFISRKPSVNPEVKGKTVLAKLADAQFFSMSTFHSVRTLGQFIC